MPTTNWRDRALAAEASRDEAVAALDKAAGKFRDLTFSLRTSNRWLLAQACEFAEQDIREALARVTGQPLSELAVPCQEPERSGLVDGGPVTGQGQATEAGEPPSAAEMRGFLKRAVLSDPEARDDR